MNIFSFLTANRISSSLLGSLEGLLSEIMVNYDHDHNARDAMIDTVIIYLQSLKQPVPAAPVETPPAEPAAEAPSAQEPASQ